MGGSWFRVRQCLIICLTLFTFGILFHSYSTSQDTSFVSHPVAAPLVGEKSDLNITVVGRDDGSRRNSSASAHSLDKHSCNIPKLDINGKEVIDFFRKPSPLTCDKTSEKNWAYLDDEAKFTLIPEKAGAKCTAISFARINDNSLSRGQRIEISQGERLPSDFSTIRCNLEGKTWSGLMMNVVRLEKREEELKRAKRGEDWSGLDVYFLGFDSLSQMSFRRTLPKTVEFLENELGSVVLNGYNIVGDGTPQAFIPILTGSTEEELPLTRKRFKTAKYVDEAYPFVWKNFSQSGYITGYGEDAANIGTFTYRLKGFRDQPTDHYTRTFFQEAEKVHKDWKCVGSEPLHQSWLRYAKEFMDRYTIPRFLLMHYSILSHDDINLVGVMDDDLSSHLRLMAKKGALDNALVIVMADHGHRFAKLRETHQGQLEERLPFFSLALPKEFRESERGREAWANLKINKDRLTTPFDIHPTLLHILHWPADFKTEQDATNSRSLSLWQPIPQSRSCAQAGVAPHWCTCLNWQGAMASQEDTETSFAIARAIVKTINDETEKERKSCAPLALKEIHYSKKLVPNEGLMKYKNVKDADGFVPDLSGTTKTAFAHYQLKLATTPGRAIYEVTVLYHITEKRVEIDLAAISHPNAYGQDPHCIIDRNYFLASFCICYDRIGATD
ncbi:hypothetical protein PENTCL1PPCAC_18006 [Pristionchus entomophagus]|uniref:Uncharacterized protein n=1 Tax=Pristionchus entomophagus TaxID=358040 RepID=A0AAV5TNC1_9BILA|nr:hypothetical protein PENTCL1PPCAC_18006 [Pristionchus entomophagus]